MECNGGVHHRRNRRVGAAAALLVAGLAAFGCTEDDDPGGRAQGTGATSAEARPATTVPATTIPATTPPTTNAPTTTAAAGPSGPRCSPFPSEGPRSLAAIAEEPVGTAISRMPRLSALVAAIDAAGLFDALNGPGPLTLFAPVNAAFDAIPPADLEAMLTDSAALNATLLYHAVTDQRLSGAELAAKREVTTIQGQPLSFAGDGVLTINGGQARVICADIRTANATLHLIDAVLTPPPSEANVVGGTMLYSLDLATGAATRIGPIGSALGVIGLAFAPGRRPTVYGLTDVPELVTFAAADPATITSSLPITGVAPDSSLLAIDVRPAGEIVALSDASVLYTIDPETGSATAVGRGLEPPVADPGFGFDVDPATERVRVDVATGQNLSVDPTGVATAHPDLAYAAGDATAGTRPRVVAAAYSAGSELYVVDVASGSLARQTPPDEGTLSTIGPLGVNVTDGASLDISASGDALLASPG
jgi:uncharacterized surface protein with fasciclin (FAS1) repeats